MKKHPRRKSIAIPLAVVLVLISLYAASEIYRTHDFLDYLVDQKGTLVATAEGRVDDDRRILQVDMRDSNGLEVTGYLKTPSAGDDPFAVILALGGIRTGKEVVNYLDETPGVAIFALDYPYEGKKSSLGAWEFITSVPKIRRALFDTVPACMLAVDYLLGREDLDPERIIFIGGSVGAMYGPVVGAAEPRLAGVGLLFGAGDLETVFRVNIHAPAPLPAAGAWIVSLLLSPLEPLKYVGRVSPRPLFMLNGRGDDRMPISSSELLHQAAGDPKTIRWIDTGHVHIRSTEFHETIRSEIVDWLVENGFVEESF